MNAERIRLLRLGMYVAAGLVCAIVSDGFVNHVAGALATFLALVLYWLEGPKFFRLVMMWCGGYLLIIAPEGINDAERLRFAFGDAIYGEASRCLVLSHLATLLGHDLIFSESRVRPPRDHWRVDIPTALPALVVASGIVVAFFFPLAVQVYQSGRVGAEVSAPSVTRALLQGVALPFAVVVPIAGVWCAKQTRGSRRKMFFAISAAILVLLAFTGVRFLLLFTSVGSAVAWLAPRTPSRRTAGVFIAVAVGLALTSTVLRQTRTYGFRDAELGTAAQSFSLDDFVMEERVNETMCMAVVYTQRHGLSEGLATGATLVFWVPRAVWAGKPKLMGYWLPREFHPSGYFSEGYSAAQGFAGTAYVDFGLWGSVLFWFAGGLVFGAIERSVARVCAAPADARILFAAPLYGGTFFSVRSFDTALQVLLGVMLFSFLLLIVAGRRSR